MEDAGKIKTTAVTELVQAQWLRRMAELKVRPEDLEETFVHSSGPGGQNVNKTSTAVVLRHRPTGLQVRCEKERSQSQNRLRARELLLDKIEQQRRQAMDAQRAESERRRRQERKRPRGVQRRILENKARQAVKKRLRRGVREDS
jgi:protein subunit release factor B